MEIPQSLADLEPEDVRRLCADPVFRALARHCLEHHPGPERQLDFKGDTFDPLSDPLDDPLPEELDECPD